MCYLAGMTSSVPTGAISRLVKYLYAVIELEGEGRDRVMSAELAQIVKEPITHVRKDLSYFGRFGVPGHGYSVTVLRTNLERILGAGHPWEVVLIGSGTLAQAICEDPRLNGVHVELRGVFDVDPAQVGVQLGEFTVQPIESLAAATQTERALFAFIAVPEGSAQRAADHAVMAGIQGILNFSNVVLKTPEHVHVEDQNLLTGVHRLSFYYSHPDLRNVV